MNTKAQIITEPVPCGAVIVGEELNKLLEELHELLTRCTTRIQPVLRNETLTESPCYDKREVASDLFTELYSKLYDCRAIVRDYHSVIDRIDL